MSEAVPSDRKGISDEQNPRTHVETKNYTND